MPLTLDDYRDKLLLALVGLFASGLIYIAALALGAVQEADVKQIVEGALQSSPYSKDKASIQNSIQDLYRLHASLAMNLEKQHDWSTLTHKEVDDDLSTIRIQIERLEFLCAMNRERIGLKKLDKELFKSMPPDE